MRDFTDTDIEQIEQLVDNEDSAGARREVSELHAADIAELF